MKTVIRFQVDKRWRTHTVECIYMSDRVERYKVYGRNGFIVLESNRPYFRNKGLKHRKPQWSLVEGSLKNAVYLERIIDALQQTLG